MSARLRGSCMTLENALKTVNFYFRGQHVVFFFSSRRRHTRCSRDWSSDVCSSDLIDRWLFGVRLFKSRSSAVDAVGGGRVHLNGERVKPSHGVKPGDTVTFTRSAVVFECVVAAVPLRRGPASEAARCYDETPASKARREGFAARMKVAAGR